MTEAFQSAIDLAGHAAIGIVEAIHHVRDRAAFRRHEQIFHRDELGDREAVMYFHETELLARIANTGFLISPTRCVARIDHVAAVPRIEARLDAAADGE